MGDPPKQCKLPYWTRSLSKKQVNQGSSPKPLASQTFGVNQSAKLVPLCSEHRELLDGYIMEDTGEVRTARMASSEQSL